MKIGWNGTICDDKEAVVSVYDHGFLYGMGLFETFRTYGGKPFLLREHMARLTEGCKQLDIEFAADIVETERLIGELLGANGLKDAYIRFTVSAGEQALGLPAGPYVIPNVIVYMKELPDFDENTYSQGKPLQLLQIRRNTPEGEARLKSFHYMNNILAKRELRQYDWAGGAEGLFLDGNGHVAEGIVSNIFMLKDGICRTPAPDTGILPGITRDFVMKLCSQSGIAVEEGHYTWQQFIHADEVFITNSIQEIVPIRRCYDGEGNFWDIGNGYAGVYTKQLSELYRKATV
jgi:4-amino-4-deoxychorismate lyase